MTYPAGQAEAVVAVPIAVNINMNAAKVLIVTICLSRQCCDRDKQLIVERCQITAPFRRRL
jgi:hypothetical protein